jgi:hypothetical protein
MKPLTLSTVVPSLLVLASGVTAQDCHCLPDDSCWPSESKWAQLNSTVDGRLVKVAPIGSVCHDPYYDEAKCTELQGNWDDVETQ